MDVLELRIDLAELLADALDEGADIGPIALIAIAGDKVLAVNEIVDLAVGDVLAGTQGEQGDDLELGQRQIDRRSRPTRAVDVKAQFELADMQHVAGLSAIPVGRRPASLGDQAQPLDEDREAARFVDEIDGAALERRLLVDILAQHREENNWCRVAGAAQAAQHLEPVHSRHAPVEQDDIGATAGGKMLERWGTAGKARHLIALVDEVEAERLAEQIIVVNEDDMRRNRRFADVRQRVAGNTALGAVRQYHYS